MPPCPGFRDNSQHVRQQDLLHCIRHSANTTLQDFEAKCKALLTSMLVLPVAQNNYLKFDMLTQNDAVKNTLTALGFPAPQPATEANWMAIRQDTDYMKLVTAAQPWGFQTEASVFLSNVVTKLDSGANADTNVIIGIHKAAAGLNQGAFFQALSGVASTLLDLETPTPINVMRLLNGDADALAAAGFTWANQPAVISITEWKSLTTDLSGNLEVKAFVAQAVKTLNGAHTFCSTGVKNVFTSSTFIERGFGGTGYGV
ncbi:hypothetical protein FB45DRAFT_1130480 [Roridomyces roridus]|uniref:Uncharacterized protein n=1 Tax=Roridomyces roridus TaxID=1738132 RepID=A0AAD7FA99_9AGAR|nr:hypothetical protein FB45DRAFT_1130480 [Roridomyces roridus]